MLDFHRSRRVLTIIAMLVAGLALQFGAQVVEAITSPPNFVLKWGATGTDAGEFDRSAGIALDSQGDIYVADFDNHRVQVFDGGGNYLRQWGSFGTGDGEFDSPLGIAIDDDDNIYVAERNGDRVQKFDSAGNFLAKWGTTGNANGEFLSLRDISVDPITGNIVTLENGGNSGTCFAPRVQRFDSTGGFIDSWCPPSPSSFIGTLQGASGITIDASGVIYIAGATDTSGVYKYTSSGVHIEEFVGQGTGNGQFSQNIGGLAVDADGNIYVADGPNTRVQVLGADGGYLTQWGVAGTGDGEFLRPIFLALSQQGDIYVSDIVRNDIQKFAPDTPNGPPTVTSVSADLAPVEVNATVNGSGTFTDDDDLDNHTAEWDWGDGNTSAGTVDQSANTVSGSHSYDTPGVYTVSVTVTDPDADDPNSDTLSSTEYVVVYDPDGGFVTGGGWIDSPAGAYAADPDLTGRANFGFVSKYKKGANVPTGNTNFQFQAGDLHFNSASYEWLVIAGQDKAKYKGDGTINGAGSYKFMLTAIDNGNSGDEFHIKIWDDNGGGVIYDNRADSGDDDYAGTVIGGGNIKVHKK